MITVISWLGIIFCLTQSAMFSGLNLAFFSLSRLQLEVEAERGDKRAAKMLKLRQDSNFLLATILWGNVSINVLLTMLSDSVMAGVFAFLFSTIAITFWGNHSPGLFFKARPEGCVHPVTLHSVLSGSALSGCEADRHGTRRLAR